MKSQFFAFFNRIEQKKIYSFDFKFEKLKSIFLNFTILIKNKLRSMLNPYLLEELTLLKE